MPVPQGNPMNFHQMFQRPRILGGQHIGFRQNIQAPQGDIPRGTYRGGDKIQARRQGTWVGAERARQCEALCLRLFRTHRPTLPKFTSFRETHRVTPCAAPPE